MLCVTVHASLYAKSLEKKKKKVLIFLILSSWAFESFVIDYFVSRDISSVYKVIYNFSLRQILDTVSASSWAADTL